MIKAIETKYAGIRFRSRLEARWAVFFDALDIEWVYEPEGFEITSFSWEYPEPYRSLAKPGYRLPAGVEPIQQKWWYLPDFYLPAFGCWVEVKGSMENVTDDYLTMIGNAIDWGGCLPGVDDSHETSRGLLWLGDIPRSEYPKYSPYHPIIQHHKGGIISSAYFDVSYTKGCDLVAVGYAGNFDATWGDCGTPIREGIKNVATFKRSIGGNGCQYKLHCAYEKARCERFDRLFDR
jgi:hypothetical protein